MSFNPGIDTTVAFIVASAQLKSVLFWVWELSQSGRIRNFAADRSGEGVAGVGTVAFFEGSESTIHNIHVHFVIKCRENQSCTTLVKQIRRDSKASVFFCKSWNEAVAKVKLDLTNLVL